MESVIEHAVKAARYNESVVVSLSSSPEDSSFPSNQEIVLVAQLDEANGGLCWNRINDDTRTNDHENNPNDDDDDDFGIVLHLKTKRWVLAMLNDHVRNRLYDQAIQAACQEVWRRFQTRAMGTTTSGSSPTIHAIDIGSGTGLLAMMTARHMQNEIHSTCHDDDLRLVLGQQGAVIATRPQLKITALEMSSAMARLAKRTIASNHLQHIIEVVETHSCEVTLDPAHLCISELLESGLLGEGVLPALRDAWKRHLHPDAVVVPQRARVFAQVLEGRECIGKYWGPYDSTEKSLRLVWSAQGDNVMMGEMIDGLLIPLHANKLFPSCDDDLPYDESIHARTLSEPVQVLSFDFTSRDSLPDLSGRCQTTSFVPTRSGVAHGVLFWWELDLWEGLTYTTEYGKQPWQDHWRQCLFVFALHHSDCPRLIAGEVATLIVKHDEFRISFQVLTEKNGQEQKSEKRRRTDCVPPLISPIRAFQLNDDNRIKILRSGIAAAIYKKGPSAPVLDLSDFSLGAILSAMEGAVNVLSLESSSGDSAQLSSKVAVANDLPRTGASFQILQCYAEQLTLDTVKQNNLAPFEIVVAEPYFEILEGWHLLEAMNYFLLIRGLRLLGVISKTALIVPAFASVKGAAVTCAELWKAYSKCGDDSNEARVCGFQHNNVNSNGVRFEEYNLCLPSWQYDVDKLSGHVELAQFHFDDSHTCLADVGGQAIIKFSKAGICHGIMVWIEYGLSTTDSSGESCFNYISTDDKHHNQLMHFLTTPVVVRENSFSNTLLKCTASFGSVAGVDHHHFHCEVV